MTEMHTVDAPAEPPSKRRWGPGRFTVVLLVAILVVFWGWALFFASKEPINRIGDEAWAARAEQSCQRYDLEREQLADYRKMADATPELVRERADIVERSTDLVEHMLDEVVAVPPADAKGLDLVPQWEADYRAYIATRRVYADQLRETGSNVAFYEPEVDSIPVSERLETFAGDNRMPTCAPPHDLAN